jgi:hypothetical protein
MLIAAGRPGATYLIERLMDLAAHEMKWILLVRFKNFILPLIA